MKRPKKREMIMQNTLKENKTKKKREKKNLGLPPKQRFFKVSSQTIHPINLCRELQTQTGAEEETTSRARD